MKSSITSNFRHRSFRLQKLLGLCLALSGLNQAHGQCAATTGNKTVGATGDYVTLAAAFSDLSVNGFTGSVILELQPDYNPAETFPISIPAFSCIAGNNTVTVRPASSVTNSIQFSGASLFTLNGASNVVFDGRPGGVGTASMLQFNASANSFTLNNNAANDTLRYLTITGNNTSTSTGMIHFASGASNNVISNCSFNRNATAMPASCITSAGTAGAPNQYNKIVNNKFSNFTGGTTSYGISATTNSKKFYISGNSFFQNTANATGVTTYCIAVAGDSMVVRGNYIGGNDSVNATTGVWASNAATSSNAQRFIGIYGTTSSSNANPIMIDSNIIKGFNIASTYTTTTAGGVFSGIYVDGNGVAKIGTNGGNIIGSMDTLDAVKVASGGSTTQSSYGAGINGITLNTTGVTTVSNNQIGGLSIEGATAAQSGVVLGIYNISTNSGARMTAMDNIIGGTLQHSIRTGINGTTTGAGNATGIRDASAGSGNFNGNTIRNISAQGTGNNQSLAQGISLLTSNTAATQDSIYNNNIYNIYSSGGNGCKGIKMESSTTYAVIVGNNIHDLEQTNSNGTVGDAIHVAIFTTNVTSGSVTIAYNAIQRLLRTGTAPNGNNTQGGIYGIATNSNVGLKAYNNTIVLDNGSNGAMTIGRATVGILMSTNNNTLYNNLIQINSNQQFAACLQNSAVSISTPPTATLMTSNNNIYAVNPRDSNYLYFQGTNPSDPGMAFFNCPTCATAPDKVHDADFNNMCSAYKKFIKNSAGRENMSFLEDVAFTGGTSYPANLQPNAAGASYVQGLGKPVGFSADISGMAVSASTPDIGAFEFSTGNAVAGAGSPLANNSGAANTTAADATTTVSIYNADCELMAQVAPSGASPIAGAINAQTWIDNSQNNYVIRHTQLTPASNPATATATITLYYLQQEFNDFNAANPADLPLPTAPSDVAGIANARIQKLAGSSSDNSGNPLTYGLQTTIIPSSVTWNADSLWWAVTFDVTGFSGFFLNTNPNPTPLPVDWIAASVSLNKYQQAEINWQVNEKAVAGYDVQKSVDGSSFRSIGYVSSKGNGTNTYSFTEAEALNSKAWYRIAQKGKNDEVNYSRVMMLQNSAIYGRINIYPNPATQVLNVELTKADVPYAIYDLQGRGIMNGFLQAGKNALNVSGLVKGFYTIRIGETVQKFILN